MARSVDKLGESPQGLLGRGRTVVGSFGAGAPSARAGKIGFVLEPAPRKPPCCKTCKDKACIGRCKF